MEQGQGQSSLRGCCWRSPIKNRLQLRDRGEVKIWELGKSVSFVWIFLFYQEYAGKDEGDRTLEMPEVRGSTTYCLCKVTWCPWEWGQAYSSFHLIGREWCQAELSDRELMEGEESCYSTVYGCVMPGLRCQSPPRHCLGDVICLSVCVSALWSIAGQRLKPPPSWCAVEGRKRGGKVTNWQHLLAH